MLHRLARHRVALVICVLLFSDSPFAAAQGAVPAERPAAAQAAPLLAPPPAPAQIVLSEQDARETRNDFEALLKRLPPAVGRVMRLDPSLMRNPAYLVPYPGLAGFLQQHPEVVQNPAYYLEHIEYEFWNPRQPEDARAQAIRSFREIMEGMAMLLVMGTVVGTLLWIIRTLVEHRRWHRTSKIQTEVHTKLMDRFTSNEDLMAYMQSPSGRRFLESTPLAVEGPARSMGAPLSRILWSLQAGVVLATAALGLLFVSNRVIEEIAQPLFALGVLALAVGVGFVMSAAASFLLSRRLGLLEARAAGREPAGLTGA
jgi:hypothetical protein